MKNTVEKHQFGFSFMNLLTGGQHMHTFWGNGSVEEAKVQARERAEAYRRSYEQELNDKARAKNRSQYAPSHISVQIVGCSLWK